MNAIFLDTGILLRLLHADDPLHAIARGAMRHLQRQHYIFCTSFQNIAEFWNVSTRPASARGGLGLELAVVERRIEVIDRWSQVLIETESSYMIWRRLISAHAVSGAAVHDARLAAIMLANGIDKVLTLNDRDFHRYEPEGISVLTAVVVSAWIVDPAFELRGNFLDGDFFRSGACLLLMGADPIARLFDH